MTHNPSYGVTRRNDTSVNSIVPMTPNIEMNESHYEYITKGKNKLPETHSHNLQKTRSNTELGYLSLIED